MIVWFDKEVKNSISGDDDTPYVFKVWNPTLRNEGIVVVLIWLQE